MNNMQMVKIIEDFIHKSKPVDEQIKVIQVPDYKTVYIEQNDEAGRSILLYEFQVDGKPYWAGYSGYSKTVYVSKASRDES